MYNLFKCYSIALKQSLQSKTTLTNLQVQEVHELRTKIQEEGNFGFLKSLKLTEEKLIRKILKRMPK